MILKYIHDIDEYSTDLIIICFLLFQNSTIMCLEITRVIQHSTFSQKRSCACTVLTTAVYFTREVMICKNGLKINLHVVYRECNLPFIIFCAQFCQLSAVVSLIYHTRFWTYHVVLPRSRPCNASVRWRHLHYIWNTNMATWLSSKRDPLKIDSPNNSQWGIRTVYLKEKRQESTLRTKRQPFCLTRCSALRKTHLSTNIP